MYAFLLDVNLELLAQKVAAGADVYEAAVDLIPKGPDEHEDVWKNRVRDAYVTEHFQNRLEDIRYENAMAAQLTPNAVIAEVTKILKSNMADFIRISDSGDPVLDLSAVSRHHMSAIQEVSMEVALKGEGECQVPVKQTKIKLYNRLEAAKQAAAILGMGKSKVELTGADGGPIQVDNMAAEGEAAKKILQEFLDRGAKQVEGS